MGVFWFSNAEVVTIKPHTVKKLIEEIVEEEDVTSVYDLEIRKKSIFFNSGGYGCYGEPFENPSLLLFEEIFKRFEDPLICFEYVIPCQAQGYCFSSIWKKREGKIDWDNEYSPYSRRNFHIFEEANTSANYWHETFLDEALWYLSLNDLEKIKDHLPNLYAAYSEAKKEEFDLWIEGPDDTQGIDYELACELGYSFSDNEDNVLEDCKNHSLELLKKRASRQVHNYLKRFPKLQTSPKY